MARDLADCLASRLGPLLFLLFLSLSFFCFSPYSFLPSSCFPSGPPTPSSWPASASSFIHFTPCPCDRSSRHFCFSAQLSEENHRVEGREWERELKNKNGKEGKWKREPNSRQVSVCLETLLLLVFGLSSLLLVQHELSCLDLLPQQLSHDFFFPLLDFSPRHHSYSRILVMMLMPFLVISLHEKILAH